MNELDLTSTPFKNKEASRGKLLIAEPFLNDPYFKRSVVLLTEHNEKGSFGFILNKPIDLKLNEAIAEMPYISAPIHLGGPVGRESLHFLHTLGDTLKGSLEVLKGLYWGGDFDQLKDMITAGTVTPEQVRFFVGYAGWSPKQLDEELERNDWIVVNARINDVMKEDTEDMWHEILVALGKEYAILANFPADPSFN